MTTAIIISFQVQTDGSGAPAVVMVGGLKWAFDFLGETKSHLITQNQSFGNRAIGMRKSAQRLRVQAVFLGIHGPVGVQPLRTNASKSLFIGCLRLTNLADAQEAAAEIRALIAESGLNPIQAVEILRILDKVRR